MKILIAYDGTHGADDALDDLVRAGLPADAEASVLTVADASVSAPSHAFAVAGTAARAWSMRHPHEEQASGVQRARDIAQDAAARIRARFPGWRVSSDALGGAPACSIVMRAGAWSPDLVVVGRRGSATSGSLLLGSVARRVLSETHCSIRIGRAPSSAQGGPQRILVCHDGGGSGQAALFAAAARSWPAGSQVRVVAVGDAGAGLESGPEDRPTPCAALDHAGLREVLDDDAARAHRPGLEVWAEIARGVPTSVLLRTARRWNADCVFVGTTSRSRASRSLLGSVSSAVAERASCSVEVVRARAAH
jgi:nucleotide-binding universal stress UspA family protein